MSEFLQACSQYPTWAFLTMTLVAWCATVFALAWCPVVSIKDNGTTVWEEVEEDENDDPVA